MFTETFAVVFAFEFEFTFAELHGCTNKDKAGATPQLLKSLQALVCWVPEQVFQSPHCQFGVQEEFAVAFAFVVVLLLVVQP